MPFHPAVIAAGIGAASLIGSTAMSTFGGGSGTQSGLHEDDWVLWEKNKQLQKEFAQKGIQWRVEDGKRAGIHPLAAIGAQGQSGNPILIGSSHQYKESKSQRAAKMIAAGGQGLARTIASIPGKQQIELNQVQLETAKEQLQGLRYHNMKLAREINEDTQLQIGGNGNLGIIESNLPPDAQLIRQNPQRYKADMIGVQAHGVHSKQAMFDEFGNLDFGLNQLTSEAYESDPVNQIKMVKRQLARHGNLAFGRPIDTPDGVIPFREFVRKQVAFLNSKYKYKGYKIGYSPKQTGFRLVASKRVMPSGFIRAHARTSIDYGSYGSIGKWFRKTYKNVHK